MKIKTIIGLIIITAIAAVWSSCGGSSGGDTPSTVVSANSIDGATGIPTDSTFRYTFSNPVAISTVTTSSYFIVPTPSGSANVVKAAYDPTICNAANALSAIVDCPSSMSCDLAPSDFLEEGMQYSICLSTDIFYAAGYVKSLGTAFEGFMATFTTAGSSYLVGGTVSGLDEGDQLVLQNNGGDNLTVTTNGTFTFTTQLADGEAYSVSVLTAPTYKTCTVGNGTGTIANADVTNVSVVCSFSSFTVGGTVLGLGAGKSVVLRNNSADDLTISADGEFTFATVVADGGGYDVTVKVQPAAQICVVKRGSGTISGEDVTNVSVSCAALSDSKDITSFVIGSSVGVITGTGIAVTVPYGTDVTLLTPIIVHTGTTLNPVSGVAQNFTTPVDYTVTAANGSTKTYTVTVTVEAPSDIATVTSEFYTVSAGGTPSETITDVPDSTSKATFLAGLTKGESHQTWDDTDISDPVQTGDTLVVTAQDGTTEVTYTLTVVSYALRDNGPAGGWIFYVNPNYPVDSWKYLEAAPSDQAADIQWYNGTYVSTGAAGTALGTGQSNTTNIVTVQGAGNYAAQLCDDLAVGVYNDWFLPSKDELNKIYINLVSGTDEHGVPYTPVGGLVTTNYWSSSEYSLSSATDAWFQGFYNGSQTFFDKSFCCFNVRAVRRF
ncbi:MAG: Ig-like domain-containing protein [Pseudomonadota bacterium]